MPTLAEQESALLKNGPAVPSPIPAARLTNAQLQSLTS